MAYTKIVYQNSPSTATPLNAENLNHMDDQIALNDQRLTEIETSYVKSFNGRKGEVAPENGDYDIGQIAPLTGAQVGQVPVVVNHGTEQDPELAFEMGAGGGGGHSIIDSEGNTMPQESAMQFADSHVSDDPTNGKTVIENIKEHTTKADYDQATEDGFHVIDDGNDVPIGEIEEDYVEVTADGVKTVATLLSELYAEIDFDKVTDTAYLSVSDGTVFALTRRLTNELRFGASHTTGTDRVVTLAIRIKELSSDCQFTQNTAQSNGNTIASNNAYQYPNGTKITLYYGTSSTVINLKTSADYCMMSDGVTSVGDAIDELTDNEMSTYTDITTYTSSSNMYQAPSDGYILIRNGTGAIGKGVLCGSNKVTTISIGVGQGDFTCFVKKGMYMYCANSPTEAYFVLLS